MMSLSSFFFHPVPRAEGVGVPKVEVDLDEGGMHLEGDGAASSITCCFPPFMPKENW